MTDRYFDLCYQWFNHLLGDLNLVWLDPSVFSIAVQEAGSSLDNCWGFIDRTAYPIARLTLV